MYIANVDENGFDDNPHLDDVRTHAAAGRRRSRCDLRQDRSRDRALDEADKAEFLADLGIEEPGLNRVIRAGYELLGLHTFFTAGPKEVRAWTTRRAPPRRRRRA